MEPPEIWAKEPDFEALKKAYAKLEHNSSEAIGLLQELRSRGSTMALVYLGSAYERGVGVTEDFASAEKYYKLAREAGSIGGILGLGSVYMRQGNYVDAEKAFLSGTEKGDMRSIHWLARIYLRQKQDTEKQSEAIKLLERAYKMGHILSGRILSKILVRGSYGILGIFRGIFLVFQVNLQGIKLIIKDASDERISDAL